MPAGKDDYQMPRCADWGKYYRQAYDRAVETRDKQVYSPSWTLCFAVSGGASLVIYLLFAYFGK